MVAVCDRDEGRARAFAARYGIARVYTSLEAMLSAGELDAVHVLLPPELHAQAAGMIIDGGVDVFLEKPMAITALECEGLIERARSTGVKVGVGHNFLFAPIYERLKQDLTPGRLGRPDEITITWNKGLGQLQSGPFNLWMLREPGNILLEVGSALGGPHAGSGRSGRDSRVTGDEPYGIARRGDVLPPMACAGRPGSVGVT